MTDFITDFWDTLLSYITGVWDDFVEFIKDLPILIIKGILDAISSLFESIPIPSFIDSGLSDVLNALGSDILFLLNVVGFPQALAILGAGFTFRMMRKLFTMGQW